jgi:hypothetical protein
MAFQSQDSSSLSPLPLLADETVERELEREP